MFSFFKKIIGKINQDSIGTTALIVSFFGVLSRILGFLRDRALFSQFPLGDTTDIYYASFRLPDLLFDLLITGVLGASLIPVFSDILSTKDTKRAWRCANGVFLVLVLVFSFLSIMCMIFTSQLILLIIPGFPEDKMIDTVKLTRILLLNPVLFGASAVLGNFLISMKKIIVYSSASILYNLGIIFGIIFLAPRIGIEGLALGAVFGAFLYFLVYFITIRFSLGFKLVFSFDILKKNYDALKVFKTMIPRLFSGASSQISLYFSTIFASGLGTGSLSVLSVTDKIQSVIIGLIGFPFALATFTSLTEAYSQENYTKFSYIFSKTMRRILYFVVPLSFILFILREPVVRIYVGTRNLSFDDTTKIASVLGIACIGIFAASLIPLLSRGFFAMQDSRTPLYIAFLSQILNILLIVFLIKNYDIFAIAIASTSTTILNATLLFIILAIKNDDLKYFKVLRTFFKVIFASGISSVVVYWTRNFIGDQLSLRFFWQVFLQLVIPSGIGLVCYLFITALMKMDEFDTIRKKIIIRIFGEPQVATEEGSTILE